MLFWCSTSGLKQSFAAITSLLLHLSMGICQGFSAVLLPQILSQNSSLQVTDDQASWIASSSTISMPIGALFVGILMDIHGRKKIVQLSFIPLILGWAVISQANSVLTLCIGRVITGFAIGMDPATIVYIAETNTPKYRSIFLSLTGPMVLQGILFSYVLGHYLFWKNAAMVLSIFSAICSILFFIIPESPVWLISKNHVDKATESLTWFRIRTQLVNSELEELQNAKILHAENCAEETSLIQKIIISKAWKPFGILALFFCLQQFTGNSIILYYAVNFYESFGTTIDSFTSSLIYIIVSLFSSFACTAVIERYNRKTLTIVSAVGVCITCFLTAIYEYLYENVDDKPLFWFPLVCMWMSVAFSSLGLTPLPWLMAGELLPSSVRGFMSSILWTVAYFFMFVTVKIYPPIVTLMKIYGILTMFSVSALISVFFGIYILPDTRGKTLTEIESFW